MTIYFSANEHDAAYTYINVLVNDWLFIANFMQNGNEMYNYSFLSQIRFFNFYISFRTKQVC